MKLSMSIPSIHRVFKMIITDKMTFDDFLNEILLKCESFKMKCYKDNLKPVIYDELVTKDNWEMFKMKYTNNNVDIISRLIIKPVECKNHK